MAAAKQTTAPKPHPIYLGKHGLLGDSGIATDETGRMVMHLAAPYDADGRVFVEIGDPADGMWRRCTPAQAKAWGKKPIPCSRRGCGRPAVRLDHHWPYYSDMNACDKHAR